MRAPDLVVFEAVPANSRHACLCGLIAEATSVGGRVNKHTRRGWAVALHCVYNV